MKNVYFGQFIMVFVQKIIHVLPNVYVNEKLGLTHDSVRILTTEVKNNGGGLLIVLQKATTTHADSRATTSVVNTTMIPLPFDITPTDLQACCFYSYTLSP